MELSYGISTCPFNSNPATARKLERFYATIIMLLLLVGLVAGGLIGFAVTYSILNGKINTLQNQLQNYSQNPIQLLKLQRHLSVGS